MSSSFPHSFGDHPQAWQSWRTTSLFQGSLAQEVPGGGQDSLWLPVNLVITVALLAHRLLLRLLPAHCFPRSQPWVSLQFSFTLWLILVLNLGPAHPQDPLSTSMASHTVPCSCAGCSEAWAVSEAICFFRLILFLYRSWLC